MRRVQRGKQNKALAHFPPDQEIQNEILSKAEPVFPCVSTPTKNKSMERQAGCENIPEEVEAGEGRVPTLSCEN
jgi:hypothetical protein